MLDVSAERVQQLADKLNCATEDDFIALAKVSPVTVQNWRKRGEGPPVILVGNAYLYPLAGLSAWMAGRVRERRSTPAAASVL